MKRYEVVTFNCAGCGQALETTDYAAGELVTCPCCAHEAAIDLREAPPQKAPRRRGREDGGVPVRLGLGKEASFETTVSRKDAGRMGHTFLGGILVALGVFVCALLGINFSNQS